LGAGQLIWAYGIVIGFVQDERRPFMRLGALTFGCVALAATANTVSSKPVTFNKDVLPVLQKNCQSCHRAGEVAPMTFMTYQDTQPWAKAIKTAVLSKENAAVVRRSALRTFSRTSAP
jgi:hypothetical protein